MDHPKVSENDVDHFAAPPPATPPTKTIKRRRLRAVSPVSLARDGLLI
jgi:hypothetical protein